MPRMSDLARTDDYETEIRATPWFSEFKAKYGEEPNLNDPNYDYRAAWAAGVRPTVRDPGDGLLHWDSRFKGENHPNRYVGGIDTKTGAPVDYGYSDLGVPIGAAVGEPKVTDYGQADLRPFAMGALAQQRDYQPTDAKGGDLWGYQTAGGLTTPQDVERATQMALAFSGGGLKTKSVPELGALLDPKGGSGNWMIRHVEGQPVMADEGTHGFSALRTGKDPSQMNYQVSGQTAPTRNVWDIADLEGKDLIFGVKDRTAGGGVLTHVGDRKLRSPVPLEAGADYSYLHEGKPLPGYDADTARIFASASQAAASKLNNEALRSLEAGRDPIFTSMVMARGAGDSAKQTANTAYQLAKQSRPSSDTVELIDNQMRALLAAEKVKTHAPYPGFGSGELGAWLDEAGLKARSAFVKALDNKKVQASGSLPDIGEVRYAHTDPRLRTTPTGSSGLFMARMRPDLNAGGVDSLHSNYPSTILGSKADRGGLAGSVPFHVIAPDRHRELLAAGEPRFFANNPAQLVMTNMPTGITKTQTVTPEVVDRVSEFFRRYPQGFAFAGGAPIAMGAIAAQDKYQPEERM